MEEARLGEVIKEIVITQFMRIIERFVKNDTPYFGNLVLRFEKNPNYKSTKKGFLNKIHFILSVLHLFKLAECNKNDPFTSILCYYYGLYLGTLL